jgi:non-canonical purine NTP pyrophosphatase (RdgB/HAM1 family)
MAHNQYTTNMKKIYFATTNEGKINEAKALLDIEVEGVGLPIDEIQSLDTKEVAIKKAKAYWEKLKMPILVEDVSLTFEALSGLPGTYINDFSKSLGNQGLIELLQSKSNRSAEAITTLVFIDEAGVENVFQGIVKGEISTTPKGENGFGWDPIFIPSGSTQTLAEMDMETKNMHSMRARAFEEFKAWLKNLPS